MDRDSTSRFFFNNEILINSSFFADAAYNAQHYHEYEWAIPFLSKGDIALDATAGTALDILHSYYLTKPPEGQQITPIIENETYGLKMTMAW